jgi:hypothetical protein
LKNFIAIILNFILNINFSLFRINFYFSIFFYLISPDKFQGNLSGDKGSSSAIIETVLNMDENKAWNTIVNQPKAIKDKWS